MDSSKVWDIKYNLMGWNMLALGCREKSMAMVPSESQMASTLQEILLEELKMGKGLRSSKMEICTLDTTETANLMEKVIMW
jgi:hypothetical protein